MYSLILMSALSTSPTTPEFNGFFRDLFSFKGFHERRERNSCNGGLGGSNQTSRGTSCNGSQPIAAGSSCNGSREPARAAAGASCQGSMPIYASSGCCGSTALYYGSCVGSMGPPSTIPLPGGSSDGFAVPTPTGPMSSNYLPLYTPLVGPMIGPVVGPPVLLAPSYSGYYPLVPQAAVTPSQATVGTGNESILRAGYYTPSPSPTASADRASVRVVLPADALLFVENRRFQQTGSERSFLTPPLEAKAEYDYTFRIEYLRQGEKVIREKTVTLAAGRSVTVRFEEVTLGTPPPAAPRVSPEPSAGSLPTGLLKPITPETARATVGPSSSMAPLVPAPLAPTATRPASPTNPPTGPSAQPARITVKLPPGATLYIDGRKNERAELIREFTTPPIPFGQEYAYVMKAERLRNGIPESQTMKVPFRAGETQQVDFTIWPGGQ